eukprot:9849536-Ditylum_brightwellii.AAC.1
MSEKDFDLFNALNVGKCCKCSTSKSIQAILAKEALSKHVPNQFKCYLMSKGGMASIWVLIFYFDQTLRGGPALLDTITGVPSAKKA